MHKWTVSSAESGLKLIPFLKKKLKQDLPIRQIRWLIEHNRCTVNNMAERYCSTELKPGDIITFRPDRGNKLAFDPKCVLFEDEYFLIYNKPSFVSSVALLRLIPRPCFLVHRLDKETSGIILLAKTRAAQQRAEALFRKRLIKKSYLALIEGRIKEKSGVIESFVAEVKKKQGETHWGVVSQERGVFAKTEWENLKSKKGSSFLRVHPITGRTHQIRVHLSFIKHPICGDTRYGSREIKKTFTPDRTLLHAEKLTAIHPFTQEPLMAFAPLPADFRKALSALQL